MPLSSAPLSIPPKPSQLRRAFPRIYQATLLVLITLFGSSTHVACAAAPALSIYEENAYVEGYNRMMHQFNGWLFSWIAPADGTRETVATYIPEPLKIIVGNFLSNLINEPLTIAASLLERDNQNALQATVRLTVNSTLGIAGLFDIAGRMGFVSDHRDLGLAMCRYGIPAGPHIVVPLVGPRTLRDGTADVVLVNVMYLTMLATVFSAAPNAVVIASIVFMETVGDLVMVRQIDSPETVEMNEPYEVVRDHYLNARALRCQTGGGGEY